MQLVCYRVGWENSEALNSKFIYSRASCTYKIELSRYWNARRRSRSSHQGSGSRKWSSGEELHDSALLQRALHKRLQENNWSGLSWETDQVSICCHYVWYCICNIEVVKDLIGLNQFVLPFHVLNKCTLFIGKQLLSYLHIPLLVQSVEYTHIISWYICALLIIYHFIFCKICVLFVHSGSRKLRLGWCCGIPQVKKSLMLSLKHTTEVHVFVCVYINRYLPHSIPGENHTNMTAYNPLVMSCWLNLDLTLVLKMLVPFDLIIQFIGCVINWLNFISILGAQVCVLAFSTTDRESFLAVENWKKKVVTNVMGVVYYTYSTMFW